MIEKNDVNISKLFVWGAKFPILGPDGSTLQEVYIRLVGDAELNRARIYAIRSSAELRKKLKTPDSDERVVFLPDLDEFEKEDIIDITLSLYTKIAAQLAVKEVRIPYPTEPKSDANLEEQEKYQALVDSYPERRDTAIRDFVLDVLENKRKELENSDIEKVKKEYEKLMSNELCEQEMIKKFRDYCAYFGSFLDSEYKKPVFKSFEDFDNLPGNIKEQFINDYQSLEIDIESLKKLPEVMQ